MTKRFKTAFASLAVATLCTFGASSQASAFDLLEELLGGAKYADSCGCSQKSGGHVQRCGSNCGSKSYGGVAQQSDKGHVQHAAGGKGGSFGGPAQRGGKGGSCGGHAQRGGCDSKGGSKGGSFGGHAQRGGKGGSLGGHAQRGGKGGSCGGHAQRGGCDSKGGSKGGSLGGHAQRGGKGGSFSGHAQRGGKGSSKGGSSKSSFDVDLLGSMRSQIAHMKCRFGSKSCSCGKGDGKGVDLKDGGYYGKDALIVPVPSIGDGIRSLPVPVDPDPTT